VETTPILQNSKFLEMIKDRIPLFPKDTYESIVKQHGNGTIAMLEALIDKGLMQKGIACQLWGDSIEVTYVDPMASIIQPEMVNKIPEDIARKNFVVGLYEINDVMTLAAANPLDQALIKRLEAAIKIKISPVFAPPSDILSTIDIHYSNEKSLGDSLKILESTQSELLSKLQGTDLALLSESTELIKIFDAILLLALKERASDIHIEPGEEFTRIRFRIDGKLRQFLQFSRSLQPAVIARCKIVCELNIAETRIPQDGRFGINLGTNKVNFRVSIIPTRNGEKAVLRVLAATNKKDFMSLDQMLISQSILKPFRQIVESPNGIIFVTGPTGSGKTTTLYAALHEINDPEVNISTIEDPIEISVEGLNQSQVNAGIDLKFSTILRSLLRQDPDVILVGEIRDAETAKIATEAALTGHLVLSTLHTNTAVQAILRLVEMGIEPYMVAPSILGVLGQRLAAKICERCKESYRPEPETLEKYFYNCEGQEVYLYRGKGCISCRNQGFRGRVSFHELAVVTENMRSMIARNASPIEIATEAERAGYRPLRYDGLKKALLGLTTLEEIEGETAVSFSS
jgi:type II secretory ATPase GspE/PulE/Tfp pilus assembly ATPase PilB-like protein